MRMTKVILAMVFVFSVNAFAREWNLNDGHLVESFGLGIVGKKLDVYDPDALGEWALETYYYNKYRKTKNDEFEFDAAKQWALNAFKKRIGMVKLPGSKSDIHLYLNSEFGKYDFKNQRFPLKGMTAESFIRYNGEGKVVSSYKNSKLVLENADAEKNYLPMAKEEARKFIRRRKDSYGDIDRRLVLHYVYRLKSAEEKDEFDPGNSMMTILFTGHIRYIEVMDKEKKSVLYRIVFSDNNQTNGKTK